MLRELVSKHGTKAQSWEIISKQLKTRSVKQCRQRWHQCLDPNIKVHTITQTSSCMCIIYLSHLHTHFKTN